MKAKNFGQILTIVSSIIALLPATSTSLEISGFSFLKKSTDCSSYVSEGSCCWDTDNDALYCGSGSTIVQVGPGAGGGDVIGPSSATDKAIVRFNGTGGKLVQNSSVVVSDGGTVSVPTQQGFSVATTTSGHYFALKAYDNNASAWVDVVRVINGNTPEMQAQSGAWDFGSAASVELPNGSGPTVDATGEIAVDTTSDQLQFYGASAKRAIPAVQTYSLVVPSVTDSDDMLFIKLPYGITTSAIDCIVSASTSATINIQECNSTGGSCADMATSDLACDTDGANTTSFSDSNAASGNWLKLDVASISGSPGTLTVTFKHYVTAD